MVTLRRVIASICWMMLFLVQAAPAEDQGLIKPILIERPNPTLSKALRKSAAKGVAICKVIVGMNGSVEKVEFIRSSNSSALDKFLMNWIRSWKYLPRTAGAELATGYTIVTLQYDLKEGTIEAPQPISQPLELPDSVANMASDPKGQYSESNLPLPVRQLKINSIPVEIQTISFRGRVVLSIALTRDGKVSKIHMSPEPDNPVLRDFIVKYMESTEWTVQPVEQPPVLDIPIEIDTGICKFEFGSITRHTEVSSGTDQQ